MNKRKCPHFLILIVIGLVSTSCQGDHETPTAEPDTRLPNPASGYCQEKGGTLEMRQDESGGTYGVCLFADGSECDEWAYFRGECLPASEQPSGSINPAQTHHLDQAVQLEILESVSGEPVGGEAEAAAIEIVSRLKTEDVDAISSLAGTLDGEISFTNRVRCPAQYSLIFTLADGTVESLYYHCLDGESSILWGDQVAWNVWAINAPGEFQAQLHALLAENG